MLDKFSYYLTQSEEEAVNDILSALIWDGTLAEKSKEDAIDLINRIRKTRRKAGSLESFFQQYGLNTQEGLALMSMAEALLRIPDPATANALIKDKVAGTNWLKNIASDDKDWFTRAAGLGLKLTSSTMNSLFAKLGEPVIREALSRAMKLLGKQFVVGETLNGAMKNAKSWEEKEFRFSYDVLGEGARTMRDATHYFESYKGALYDLAKAKAAPPKEKTTRQPAGISVKLSALYPRYDYAQRHECVPALSEKLIELCKIAAEHNLTLTVDAEEVARLTLSLEIIETICLQDSLKNWHGFGLAVQAYQKSSALVIDHVISLARTYGRKIQIRLVKGAYWDTEIRHAQLEGYADYPVFTRKVNTDISYLRCAQKMLKNRDVLYPMFGTHNAYSVAAILAMAARYPTDAAHDFEFQKLYGMGDALYNQIHTLHPEVQVCVYAPVGPYHDLLPYLVRRMLENGANSSFVNQIYNADFDAEMIATDPIEKAKNNSQKRHPKITLPADLYATSESAPRKNSYGFNFNDGVAVKNLLGEISQKFQHKYYEASPLIAGKALKEGAGFEKINPARQDDKVGRIYNTPLSHIDKIFDTAQTGFKIWSGTPSSHRALTLEKLGDLIEAHAVELIAMCVREGGRTLKDSHDEVREAVDFCRYYAVRGRIDFKEGGVALKSPTGESNIHTLQPRGIFVCISPWNFPLAIFIGQITAALMAGNAVVAKPAEQTSLIGFYLAKLIHQAGVPKETFTLATGDGEIGAALVQHPLTHGVVFTGSTHVARLIQKNLAEKEGAIAKLIAETGGQNAMIVDSSALAEQVVDDVIKSSFGAAGQRCSACRILYLQEDVADKIITMLDGALAELKIGDPMEISTDIGPLIDEEALRAVQYHKTRLGGFGKKIAEAGLDEDHIKRGHFFAPQIHEIDGLDFIPEEVFGPILHVIRFKAKEIDSVIDDINALGYGLTFGIHSRVQSFISHVTRRIRAGNIYVNRATIGAVVGVQPFGGQGLSGTGPKAGGAYYLPAFATEKLVSTNLTAAGGNASLVMIDE